MGAKMGVLVGLFLFRVTLFRDFARRRVLTPSPGSAMESPENKQTKNYKASFTSGLPMALQVGSLGEGEIETTPCPEKKRVEPAGTSH